MIFLQYVLSMVQLDIAICFVMFVLILFMLLNQKICEVIKKKDTNVE